jgi:two-component system NtrC family sensor kinase
MKQSSPLANRRILIIDDNHAIHEDFRKILCPAHDKQSLLEAANLAMFDDQPESSSIVGFEVDSAMQGRDGLEQVQQALQDGRPYAMAFIDVRMPPGWDGIETTVKIWEAYPDLQVVICTAYSDYAWDDMIAKVGQSDRLVILKKPFDNVEVLQLAHAFTAKWQLLQQVKARTESLECQVRARTAELHASEENFRLIAENVSDLIAVVDRQGKRLYHSPSYERVLDFSPNELGNTSAFDQVHPDDRAGVTTAALKSLESGIGQILEYRTQHRDGSWRVLEAHANPVRNARGEVDHLVMVARDITERRRTETEYKKMEAQLRHGQKMESIGQLAAGIAHEINTPTQYIGDNIRFLGDAFADLNKILQSHAKLLEAVKGKQATDTLVEQVEKASDTADMAYLTSEIPNAIQQSSDGLERVARIVSCMKDFSHPDEKEKVSLDLNRAIESTLTVCRNEWKYVAEMVTEFDSNLPAVFCLPGEINQAILNIVVNAAQAIGDATNEGASGKGIINISTCSDGSWVEIRIRDSGTGIPEHARDRIFDPFFTTKGVGKGTGQGLAIAHNIVVGMHAGTLTFETETGHGTTFIIRLPINTDTIAHKPARDLNGIQFASIGT